MGQLKEPQHREKYEFNELLGLLDKYDIIQTKLNQINANLRESTFELGDSHTDVQN
jgi:hypothetical protein